MTDKKIFPGDQITAQGHTFTVWRILYQDCISGSYDVEFIDDADGYHHWKQDQDGGHIIRSGRAGNYYLDMYDRQRIAAILPARQPGTYTARIITRGGAETYLGRYSSIAAAKTRLDTYCNAWKEM